MPAMCERYRQPEWAARMLISTLCYDEGSVKIHMRPWRGNPCRRDANGHIACFNFAAPLVPKGVVRRLKRQRASVVRVVRDWKKPECESMGQRPGMRARTLTARLRAPPNTIQKK